MPPIVTDRVAWSVGRSVGLSVTLLSRAKTAAPIEMTHNPKAYLHAKFHFDHPTIWPQYTNVTDRQDRTGQTRQRVDSIRRTVLQKLYTMGHKKEIVIECLACFYRNKQSTRSLSESVAHHQLCVKLHCHNFVRVTFARSRFQRVLGH